MELDNGSEHDEPQYTNNEQKKCLNFSEENLDFEQIKSTEHEKD